MNITIPASALKGVMVATAKENHRPILTNVLVERAEDTVWLTATDSFRAAKRKAKTYSELEGIEHGKQYLISPESAKRALAVPDKVGSMRLVTVELSESDSKFPNIDSILPKESDKVAEFSINLAFLADLVTHFSADGGKKVANVTVTVNGPSQPLTLRKQSYLGDSDVTALVCGIRTN